MIQPVRVAHYVNQFLGGIGGEEMAHVGVSLANGVVGASRALQQALGVQGTLLGTIIGGDNHQAQFRGRSGTVGDQARPPFVVIQCIESP